VAEGKAGLVWRARADLLVVGAAPMALMPAVLYWQEQAASAEMPVLGLLVAAGAALLMAAAAVAFEELRRKN